MRVGNYNIKEDMGIYIISRNNDTYTTKKNLNEAIELANLLDKAFQSGYRTGHLYGSESKEYNYY